MDDSLEQTLVATSGSRPPEGGDDPFSRGKAVGRYLVLDHLGAGAMGVVYAAYDPELDRKVAIKVLRAGDPLHTIDEARRTSLLREAQALAQLSHPNVVAVHDVGTIDEQVWIAMEFVQGHTLREWAQLQRRPWTEVLDAMQQAGRGLSAAHEAGVLHRDFKPDNVMVSEDGRVRVMDFGLAHKPQRSPPAQRETTEGLDLDVQSELAALAMHSSGGNVRGTPAYMSPEQIGRAEVDVRSDQFAFCISLWELLHGQRPFAGETVMALVSAVLREEVAPVPRGTKVPPWLRRICRRGLSRKRNDRFETMDALLDALERGRIGARRRWGMVGIGGLLAIAAGAWVFGQRRHAEQELRCETEGAAIETVWNESVRHEVRDRLLATEASFAQTTAHKIMPWIDDQASAWRDARVQGCRRATVDQTWGADTLDRSQWCLDERHEELASLVGELRVIGRTTIHGAIPAAIGRDRISACLDRAALERRPSPPPVEVRASVVEVRQELSRIAASLHLHTTQRELEASLQALKALEHRAHTSGWPPLWAAVLSVKSDTLVQLGRYSEAETVAISAYVEAGQAGAWSLAATLAQRLMSSVGYRQARAEEGQIWGHHAQMAASLAGDPNGLLNAARLNTLGIILGTIGRSKEGEQLLEQALELRRSALGETHPDVGSTYNGLGTMLSRQGVWDRSQERYTQSLAIVEQIYGPDHPEVATRLNNLCIVFRRVGAYDEAQEHCSQALDIWEAASGPEHPAVAVAATNLGDVLRRRNDLPAALKLHERARAVREKSLGTGHPYYAQSLSKMAEILLLQGEADRALTILEEAVAIYDATEQLQDNELSARFWLATALVTNGGDRVRAVSLARSARDDSSAQRTSELVFAEEIEAWLADHDRAEAPLPDAG